MDNLIVREAAKEEIENVAVLWLEMCKEDNSNVIPDKEAWMRHVSGLFMSENYHIVIAEKEGRFIGFIDGFAYYEPSTSRLIGVCPHIYILPEYRIKGVISPLYRQMMKIAKQKKVTNFQIFISKENVDIWTRKGFSTMQYVMDKEV